MSDQSLTQIQLEIAMEYLNAIVDVSIDINLGETYQIKRLALDALKEINRVEREHLTKDASMEQVGDFNFVEHMLQGEDE